MSQENRTGKLSVLARKLRNALRGRKAEPGQMPSYQDGGGTRLDDTSKESVVPSPSSAAKTSPNAGPSKPLNRPLGPVARRDIFIGFDLGTSCSRIVIRDSALGRAWAVPLTPYQSIAAYLLPTRVVLLNDGSFSLAGEGEAFSHIKIGLMDDAGAIFSETRSVTAGELGAAYMALALSKAREWFLRAQQSLYSDVRVDWWLTVGIPCKSYDDSRINDVFARVARCGWWLSDQKRAIDIPSVREAWVRAQSGDLDLGPFGQRINIYPEIAAEVAGYARSDARQNGLHLMVDVGASTLDVSTFILNETDGEDTYSFLEVDVRRQGTYYLHQHRAERLQSLVYSKYDPLDTASRLPGRCEELMPGNSEIETIDEEFIVNCIGTVKGAIVRTKGRRAGYAEQFDPKKPASLRTFLCGGGGRAQVFRDLIDRVEQSLRKNFRVGKLQIVPLPHADGLDAQGLAPEEFDRLAVAHGLSYPYLDLGMILPPSEIEDFRSDDVRRQVPELVTKDHV